MGAPANNAGRIAELEEQRDAGNGYGLYEAQQLALLTGRPTGFRAAPGLTIPIGKFQYDETGEPVYDWVTCGTCGLSWNDALGTKWTPAPSARCPFEYEHPDE